MSVQWPSTIPSSPLLDGYNSRKMDSRRITTVDAGLVKIRNRYRAVPKMTREVFVFTNEEKKLFETFFDVTCNGGAEVFIRDNPETELNANYRFVSIPEFTPLGTNWRVEFEVEALPA
jgi:hypothetical protein